MPAKKRNTQRVPKKKGKENKKDKEGDKEGGVPVVAKSNDSLPAALPTVRAREVDLLIALPRRFQREGRWPELSRLRDEMMRDCMSRQMSKLDARAWVYAELDRLSPPLPPPKRTTLVEEPAEPAATDDADATPRGLYDLPASWPPLPANASLAADIAWVQSNRLAVVEERPGSGPTRVHLDRAHEPAPSRAALGWLETSVRSYAKYVDVAARAASAQVDEQEGVRRERMAIDAIRALLDEMSEGEGE